VERDYNEYSGTVGILNSDHALVSNVRFEDIRVDLYSPGRRVVNLSINKSDWATSPRRGQIRDVEFKNITVYVGDGEGGEKQITGFGQNHQIDNITFNNFVIQGQPINDAATGKFTIRQFGSWRK